MAWIDRLDWPVLVMAGFFLAMAPFQPEPHLLEKLRMLSQGNLTQPVDIFDLLMHSAPLVLLGIKGVRHWQRARTAAH